MQPPPDPPQELKNCCELLAVRHGLTDYNAQRRLQGQLDVPLNDTGRQQCRECGRRLRNLFGGPKGAAISAIYSSPLGRTRESAEIIREAAGIESAVVLDSRLQEWNAGILQGHLLEELPSLFPKEWNAWDKSRDPSFVFPGGESFQQRYDRVKEFFLEVTQKHLGERILVVTHGGVLDDLFRLVRNVPMNVKTNAPKLNAEIHTVRAHWSSSKSSSSSAAAAGEPPPAAAAAAAAAAAVTWEIVSWGKLAKGDSRLTGEVDTSTPIDISVRGIEYA
ncbi:phosphoglycerate mutase protein, putative [Eimeria necatrix]|uniref:Phosphoglycerate mutase protein, putative n=1 Tax=Eimeria necatrix TaxID=51315 RepID=U6MNS2_9EIME|nr:phosphoglycerate mutase protein, putative [Eimeria necatrix]CDJ63320.1 phosphoglycerate mutase protein, putative [Eimeria necatrix]